MYSTQKTKELLASYHAIAGGPFAEGKVEENSYEHHKKPDLAAVRELSVQEKIRIRDTVRNDFCAAKSVEYRLGFVMAVKAADAAVGVDLKNQILTTYNSKEYPDAPVANTRHGVLYAVKISVIEDLSEDHAITGGSPPAPERWLEKISDITTATLIGKPMPALVSRKRAWSQPAKAQELADWYMAGDKAFRDHFIAWMIHCGGAQLLTISILDSMARGEWDDVGGRLFGGEDDDEDDDEGMKGK